MPKVNSNQNIVRTSGSRKTAVARVFLSPEKGDLFVNDIKIDEYFNREVDQVAWKKPFHTIGVSHPTTQFSGTIKVQGSGPSAQVDAIIHGISRALAQLDDEYKTLLSKAGLLTRDPRMVERKKYYLRKARKRPQYSKR